MIRISANRIPVKQKRFLAFFLHYLLRILFFPYLLLKNSKNLNFDKKGIRKVLIIRNDGLGDIVMSIPAFWALRDLFPSVSITLLASSWSKELLKAIPVFDEILYADFPWIVPSDKFNIRNIFRIIKEIRVREFDLAIDLRGDFRNNIFMFFTKIKYRMGFDITGCNFFLTQVVPLKGSDHPTEMALSLIKYLSANEKINLNMSLRIKDKDDLYINSFLHKQGIEICENSKPLIVIHPGARSTVRRWENNRYALIADRLIQECEAIVIFSGSKNEEDLAEDVINKMKYNPIIATGKFSLGQFLALLRKADIFIGVDSGPVHMAVAVGTKVIALYGPAKVAAVGPYSNEAIVLTKQDNFKCSPCSQRICKRPNGSCMKAITTKEVWRAVIKQLKNK